MDTTTLNQAAQQPDVAGALQQLLLSRANTPQQSQQIQQNRQSTLQQYQDSLRAPPAGNYTPSMAAAYDWVGNMGKMSPFAALSSGVSAGGKMLGDMQAAQRQANIESSKVAYNDARELDQSDSRELSNLRMSSSPGRTQGKYIQFKDDKGNLYIMNNVTGEKQVIAASQTPLWAKAYQLGFSKAVDNRNEDPEAFATNFANRTVDSSPAAVAPESAKQEPLASIPLDMRISPQVQQQRDTEALRIREGEKQGNLPPWPKLPAETVTPSPGREPLAPKDLRQVGQDEGFGKKEGEGLYAEQENMSQLHGANLKLLSQLNMLEHLYQNPNIPEGQLGPQVQGLRSGLKSLGIDVDESVGLGDMARSISTGLALSMKRADGTNLLPGAMSNYEDQLLQSMAPTLMLTNQGRLGMVEFMKEVASSNLRMAQEAQELATANKDRLPPSWSARKERVMLEEMAKLKSKSKSIIQRYGVR